jgi:hypothetical protein
VNDQNWAMQWKVVTSDSRIQPVLNSSSRVVIRDLRHEGIVDSVKCLRLLFAFGHWDSLFDAP